MALSTLKSLSLQGKKFYGQSPELLTFVTFGSLSLLASVLVLLLPETLDRALPDTVVQANRLGSGRRRTSRRPGPGAGPDGGLLQEEDEMEQQPEVKATSTLEKRFSGAKSSPSQEAGYGKSPEWVEVRINSGSLPCIEY